MFKKIMVPVDLAHAEKLSRALSAAGELSKLYGAPIVYVGVTAETPGAMAHNITEYGEKLKAFAAQEAAKYGLEATSHSVASHDPAVDLDQALVKAVGDTGSDLIVMATHIPNVADHIWPSHGGKLATHTNASVFLVRS
ncbi:universal stress protein [Rhizobium sp. L1K21]|uniref:universal stress protein n=1 Tax=Rhizobium sp. L1K21 TaxID=2954933 RepID=UPI0020923B3C|nr:universal stress protein [Rhizobium sp. L1K21]MCO6185351.1 universal stress protein [Rhizobium sp. L1K21]